MRHTFVGALVIAGLVIAATAGRSFSEPALGPFADASRVGSGELTTHVTMADSHQIVTVVDSKQRVMAVYHVEKSTGQIVLKSMRNITWDLQMIEYNSGKPLPQDIRSGLPR